MADTVRYLMEAMVPELEALEAKGYFNKQELRSIAQQRTNFEYALKRKQALLHDFIKYAEYEKQLEELRRTRRKTRGIGGKRSLADYCIARRVHFIYERATRKFRGNLGLWLTWLKHCRNTKSNIQFSKVIVKALRLHPCQPDLWICAAAWEFDVAANPSAARTFMQRGLRACPHDTRLWAEYFDMELLYAAKLRARRAALGIPDTTAVADALQDAASAAVLRGAVAEVVMQQMLKEHPDTVEAAGALLEVLWRRGWAWTQHLEASLLAAVTRHSKRPEAVALLARAAMSSPFQQHASVAAGIQEACAVYEQALQVHPSAAMYDAAVTFGMARVSMLRGGENKGARRAVLMLLQWSKHVCMDACSNGMASDAVFSARYELERHDANAAAMSDIATAWVAAHPSSSAAALRALQHCQDAAAVMATVQRVPACSAVWQAAAELAVVGGVDGGVDARALGRALVQQLVGRARGPVQGGLETAVRCIVHALLHTHGVPATHALCRRLLTVPAASCDALLCIADVYADIAAGRVPVPDPCTRHPSGDASLTTDASNDDSDDDNDDSDGNTDTPLTSLAARRWEAKALARAVEEYGRHVPHVWLRLMAAEEGRGRGSGAVYQRALKTLDPARADEFVQLATQQQQGG